VFYAGLFCQFIAEDNRLIEIEATAQVPYGAAV
jgi:hypothetical protein